MNFVRTEPGADPIIVEGRFPVSPPQVFRAWTDPDRVKKWFGASPDGPVHVAIDLRPGGRWRFTEQADDHGSIGFEGHYIEVEQYSRLVFSWCKFSDRRGHETQSTDLSTVEIDLAVDGSGTRMRIVHRALNSHDERIGFGIGWERGMAKLATELGVPATP